MGCAHSTPEILTSSETADELSRPPRASTEIALREQFQETTGPFNDNCDHPNAVPDGVAVASSREARTGTHRNSVRKRSSRTFQSATAAASVDKGVNEVVPRRLVDTSVFVGEAKPASDSRSEPTNMAGGATPSVDRSSTGPTQIAIERRPYDAAQISSSIELAAQHVAISNIAQQQQPIQSPADLVQTMLPVMIKDLLTRISAPQLGAVTDHRKLVLIVWDIENVRCPRGNGQWDPLLTPAKVLGYIKEHFIYHPGRMEYRTVAAVTPKSLNIIRKKYPNFVEQVVPELTLLVASAQEPKRNADVMLKKELYRFISEHAHIARHSPGQLTVVLLSGDEDFLEPVQVALNSGFAVELMHHEHPSWTLRSQQGYARPPLLWADFLKECSGVTQVNLPYQRKQK
ncbi:hypothetical protein Vretimale_4816 [Volvox reticuliferus]|uniref:Uncharacterized protein n=1 Tax=Volvox reticuliferus TaxID=1737510 RepID=A0A8J4DEU3_9CHLO|nr:hypothetical protein Vretifemale_4199 [Volvox reticuliferus]GIL99849.1 hypothetical protein Vretimale_4816 [Volvox reticuliferus]